MNITLACDNPRSWILPYVKTLEDRLVAQGHAVQFVKDANDIQKSDCTFLLACGNIVRADILARSAHTIVVHESALPSGKGWSPLTWQILEGKNDIPITLFEAAEKLDSGDIYLEDIMHFEGHELIEELRAKQGEMTIALVLKFVAMLPDAKGKPQQGEESFYPRRTPPDSELDPKKSLVELFDHLRVADNERYPAFFKHRGHTYILKIEKNKDQI